MREEEEVYAVANNMKFFFSFLLFTRKVYSVTRAYTVYDVKEKKEISILSMEIESTENENH